MNISFDKKKTIDFIKQKYAFIKSLNIIGRILFLFRMTVTRAKAIRSKVREQRKAAKKKNHYIETKEDLTNFSIVNGHSKCIIVDEASATWGYRMVKTTLIPKDSIPIEEGTTHLLGYDGNELWPIVYIPEDNTDKTPKDCYEAQSWDELEVILNMETPLIEKIKLGIFVALGFGSLIVFFLVATMVMGR